jgi:5-deoxy-glucuronate isomerase
MGVGTRMPRNSLLIHPSKPDHEGRIHHITPIIADWTYVGFDVYRVPRGAQLKKATKAEEVCLVLIAGTASVRVKKADQEQDFGTIGARNSPFEGPPWSIYVGAQSEWAMVVETDVELAVCSAPAEGKLEARVIAPSDVLLETRGTGSNTRHVRNILPEMSAAESLLVVEVITPAGNWSSYPPHKHDRDHLPIESYLEETYYHRLSPPQGFAVQRIYTDNRDVDQTLSVSDRDVVLVPRGYHPVGAPHGYELYYLNVMAGPKRTWKFYNDPAHQWMLEAAK